MSDIDAAATHLGRVGGALAEGPDGALPKEDQIRHARGLVAVMHATLAEVSPALPVNLRRQAAYDATVRFHRSLRRYAKAI